MTEVRFYMFVDPPEVPGPLSFYRAVGRFDGETIEKFARSEAMATAFVLDEISRKLKEKARTENG